MEPPSSLRPKRRTWTLRLAALAIALLLWIAVRAEAPNRQEFPGIPVRVEIADRDWALAEDPTPIEVTVRFAGPSRELLRIAIERPTLVIPVDQVGSGDTTVVVRPQWVRLQDRPGVIVEEIFPSSIRLSLEPMELATRPLALRLTGVLPSGLSLAALPRIDPIEARVSGPLSRVEALDSVRILPIDLQSVNGSGAIEARVDHAPVPGLGVQPERVLVNFQIEPTVERVISGIPILLPDLADSAGDGVEFLAPPAMVLIRGARSLVERVDPALLRLMVRMDATDLPAPGVERGYPLELIGLSPLLEGEPQPATVLVRRREGR